jgi:LemA protein
MILEVVVMILLVLVTLIVLLAFIVIALYNRLVRMRNTVRSAWADIDVFLRKRYNLVDNLVETVKGYASHEKETLTGVTEARANAMKASGPMAKGAAENIFQETLKSIFALSEAYPELKANESFLKLQGQLQEIENGIEYARRYYNAVVRDYNTLTEAFPSNLIAAQFSFHKEAFFELTEAAAREPVKVDFS